MSVVIERVARAIAMKRMARGYPIDGDDCREEARAAIDAIRDPTQAMVVAGESVLVGTDAPNYVSGSIFKAMIDAALSGAA